MWAEGQAHALRVAAATASNLGVDWANVAEEIEAVARSERSALANNIATVIEHLAKLEASPAIEPRIGWQETILRARATIQELLETSPVCSPRSMMSFAPCAPAPARWPPVFWPCMARRRASRSSTSVTLQIRCSATGGRLKLRHRRSRDR